MNKEKYQPLTMEQTGTLMKLVLMKEIEYNEFKEAMKDDLATNIVMKRIEALNLPKFEPTAILFISLLCNTPGKLILAMIDVLEKYDELKPDKIDVNFVAEHVYPWGFYTNECAEKEYDKRRYPEEKDENGKPKYTGKYDYIFF